MSVVKTNHPSSFDLLASGMARTGNAILWFSGILASVGWIWRSASPFPTNGRQAFLTLGFAAWVAGAMIFVRFFDDSHSNPKTASRFHPIVGWIPAALFLPLFSRPWGWLYAAMILAVVFLHQFHAMFLVRFPKRYIGVDPDFSGQSGERSMPVAESTIDKPTDSVVEFERFDGEFEEEESGEDISDGNVLQQIVRTRTETGSERLEGTFLAEFEPDRWTATIHVPFCPAFESPPEIETVILEGDAKSTVVKLQPNGVRIDVKKTNLETDRVRILVAAEGFVYETYW